MNSRRLMRGPSSGLGPDITTPLRKDAAVHHSKNCALMSQMSQTRCRVVSVACSWSRPRGNRRNPFFGRKADAIGGHPPQTIICAVYPRLHRAPAPFYAQKTTGRRTQIKHPRRTFLHLAAGATALTYLY